MSSPVPGPYSSHLIGELAETWEKNWLKHTLAKQWQKEEMKPGSYVPRNVIGLPES